MDGWLAHPTGRNHFDAGISQCPGKRFREIVILVPNPFKEDTQGSVEIRPGSPSVVHHDAAGPGGYARSAFSWGGCCTYSAIRLRNHLWKSRQGWPAGTKRSGGQTTQELCDPESVYVPGSPVSNFQFNDSAKLIRGGGDLRQVHYTPNGQLDRLSWDHSC
jgi:hypothetical protein